MNNHHSKEQSIGIWLEKALQRKDQAAIKYKRDGQWIVKSYGEYLKSVTHFQTILLEKNIKKSDRVAIMSDTRWEWAATDVATLAMGGIIVPVYPNLTDEDVIYILNHSEANILFVGSEKAEDQFNRIKTKLNNEISCLNFNKLDYDDSYISLDQIQNMISRAKEQKLNEPVTIIYTSGTTGQPKGVLLLQEALVSEIHDAFSLFHITADDVSLAFLPCAHVMGRIEHWGGLFTGCMIAYAESIDALKKNLTEVKPTILVAVPRIFEKIYSGISAQIETNPIKKTLFEKTVALAKKIKYYRDTQQVAPLPEAILYEALSRTVLAPAKKAFGGRLRFVISGGAPLSKDLGEFFSYLGIRIFEGYGLTETFAAITVNTESHWLLGSVGRPIGDVEIKFASDGEILVRSKKCLKEYYKNPEATAAVIDKEGFFATGDIGEFTSDGFLKITDRKKDLIKTAGGKYVAPQKLEGLLKKEPLISQVFICGDQKKYITALLTVENFDINSNLEDKNTLLNKLKKHVQSVNAELSSFESIKKFEVLFETWSVENGCLTPSLKVKRKFVQNRYAHLIKEMYGEDS